MEAAGRFKALGLAGTDRDFHCRGVGIINLGTVAVVKPLRAHMVDVNTDKRREVGPRHLELLFALNAERIDGCRRVRIHVSYAADRGQEQAQQPM